MSIPSGSSRTAVGPRETGAAARRRRPGLRVGAKVLKSKQFDKHPGFGYNVGVLSPFLAMESHADH